jgi:lipid II:glycine glycyltransferase (peptidoglycan interpeptide bridge formation enzyme)
LIQLVKNTDINPAKWNDCILNSNDPLFYFLYEIINIASDCKWEALIEDDYANVFPLPYRVKFGVKYYYTPTWIQRLGWINSSPTNFSINNLNHSIFIDILVQNVIINNTNFRTNYTLELNKEIKESDNTRRNLKKAIQNGFTISKVNCIADDFVSFFKTHKAEELSTVSSKDYQRLENIIAHLNKINLIFELQVIAPNCSTAARGIFVHFGKRLTYFKGCVSKDFKNTGAGHFLINHAIILGRQTGINRFDFYGGNNPGMAQFYAGFGGQKETYAHLFKNNLPKAIRWIKNS